MRSTMLISHALLLAACGQSIEEKLHDAANLSDPAAATVLDNAAEDGIPAQEALGRRATSL